MQEAPLHEELHPHAPLHILHLEGDRCLHQRHGPLPQRQRGVGLLLHRLGETLPRGPHLTLPFSFSSPLFSLPHSSPLPSLLSLLSLHGRAAIPPSTPPGSSLKLTPPPATGQNPAIWETHSAKEKCLSLLGNGALHARAHSPHPSSVTNFPCHLGNSLTQLPIRMEFPASFQLYPPALPTRQPPHPSPLPSGVYPNTHSPSLPLPPPIRPGWDLPPEGKLRKLLKNSWPVTKGSISK